MGVKQEEEKAIMDVNQEEENNFLMGVNQEEEKSIITTTAPGVFVDWLELPNHLTSIIMNKLTSITNYARFGGVCVQWLSIFDEETTKSKSLPPQLPLLMIPTPSSQEKKKNNKNKKKKKSTSSSNTISCSFYRVTDGKIFNSLRLTMPSDRYIRGSGHGWFITVDQDEICYSVQLINPFFSPNTSTSTKEIKLPPLTAHPSNHKEPVYHYMHLRKAILSADPISNPKDFIVMAIFGEFTSLSFCKSGDKAWTPIRDSRKGSFEDVIYYKGKFYAIYMDGTIVVCNIAKCRTTTFAGPPVTEFVSSKKYLFILSRRLLQVHRYVNPDKGNGITDGFKVFKLQKAGPKADWVEVKDLSRHVLFLGDNASMSISASDFPGCKPNSIYYTDDNIDLYRCVDEGFGPHDLGVFNLENGSFEKHYPAQLNIPIWPAPVWIEPTLPRSTTRSSKCNMIKKQSIN